MTRLRRSGVALMTASLAALAGGRAVPLAAQGDPARPVVLDQRGLVVESHDGRFRLVTRARLQLATVFAGPAGGGVGVEDVTTTIRRARLRLSGHLLDPRLVFLLQFGFSRQDQRLDDPQIPGIIRDATLGWRWTPNFLTTVGQFKLPGNRQRVVSSGDLQFVERALVNQTFTLDRDIGVVAQYSDTTRHVPWFLVASLSRGEGRNAFRADAGLAWVLRAEVLPFGAFRNRGDYVEGDQEREPRPRLAVGLTVARNLDARRSGGQLGAPLNAPRDFTTVYADAVLKYRGVAVYGEYANRTAADPITTAPGQPVRVVYDGWGAMLQASYRLGAWEPLARVAIVRPDARIAGLPGAAASDQYSAGFVRYLYRHRVKVQSEVSYNRGVPGSLGTPSTGWLGRLGLELGI